MKKSHQNRLSGSRGMIRRLAAARWFPFASGVVVTTAIIVALVAFSGRRSVPEPSAAPASSVTSAVPTGDHDHDAESSIRRMTPAELSAAVERGEAVVIDVRDADSYAASHIAGAVHIPLSFIESQVRFLPRDRILVTYCT